MSANKKQFILITIINRVTWPKISNLDLITIHFLKQNCVVESTELFLSNLRIFCLKIETYSVSIERCTREEVIVPFTGSTTS